MSRHYPTEYEKVVLQFPCPKCKSATGQWCYDLTVGKYPTNTLHTARERAAKRATKESNGPK